MSPSRAANRIATRSASSRRAGEHERLGGAGVEPVRVVDEAQQRLPLRRLGEQREHGERDEEPLVARAVGEAERAAQRARLRRRQPVGVAEDRPQQLVQAGVRDLRLGLDAAPAEHAHARRQAARLLEQRRLADTRLPAEDEDGAAGFPRAVQGLTDTGALSVSPVEHVRRS